MRVDAVCSRKFVSLTGIGAVLLSGLVATPTAAQEAVDGDVPVMVEGTITSDGAPASAEVVAVAWPNEAVLENLPEDAEVPLLPLATADADATSGGYALEVDPDTVPLEYRGTDGQVDMDVTIRSDTTEATWAMSVVPDATSEFWVDASTSESDVVADSAPLLSADLATGELKLSAMKLETSETPHFEPGPRSPGSDGFAAQADETESTYGVSTMAVCSTWKKELKTGVVANTTRAQGLSGVPAKVDVEVGSTGTFGIAAQTSTGAYSAGGTRTISSAAGAERSWSSPVFAQHRVNYRRYWNDCTGRSTWRPESYYALLSGAVATSRTTYSLANCTTYSSGTYWKSAGTAYTISGGVKFPNISLSAQSGWNSKVRTGWTFSTKARLCGSTSSGWVTAPWAGVQPF